MKEYVTNVNLKVTSSEDGMTSADVILEDSNGLYSHSSTYGYGSSDKVLNAALDKTVKDIYNKFYNKKSGKVEAKKDINENPKEGTTSNMKTQKSANMDAKKVEKTDDLHIADLVERVDKLDQRLKDVIDYLFYF